MALANYEKLSYSIGSNNGTCFTHGCDTKILVDLYKQGKVSSRVLDNFELMFICKTCRNIYCKFEELSKHYENCKRHLIGSDDQPITAKREKMYLPDTTNYQNRKDSEETKLDVSEMNFKRKKNMKESKPVACATNEQNLDIKIKIEKQELDDNQNDENELLQDYDINNTNNNKEIIMMIDWNKYVCLECDQKFCADEEVREHVATMHSKKHKCSLCEFQTKSKKRFKKHLEGFHEGDLDNESQVREIRYRRDEENNSHENVEPNRKKVKKEIIKTEKIGYFPDVKIENCGNFKFDETDNSIFYEDDSQNTINKISPQNLPNYEFYEIILNDEEEKLMDNENVVCLLCNLKLIKAAHLRCHLAVLHLGYSRYKCKYCGFKSSSLTNCKQHAWEIHNEAISNTHLAVYFLTINCRVKNIKQSNKILKIGSNVDAPKSIYRDERNRIILSKSESKCIDEKGVKCLFCSSGCTFTRKWQLYRHVAVCHLGYKRYQCRFCEFDCNFLAECKGHVNAFHQEKILSIQKVVIELFRRNYFKPS